MLAISFAVFLVILSLSLHLVSFSFFFFPSDYFVGQGYRFGIKGGKCGGDVYREGAKDVLVAFECEHRINME